MILRLGMNGNSAFVLLVYIVLLAALFLENMEATIDETIHREARDGRNQPGQMGPPGGGGAYFFSVYLFSVFTTFLIELG